MEKIKGEIAACLTIFNVIMTQCFGKVTALFWMVMGLMGMDLVTRIYAAGVRADERIESRKIMKGLYHKMGLCLFIMLSLILDLGLKEMTQLLGIQVMGKIIFTNVTLAWIFVRELISNLENLQRAGIEMPLFMMKALNKTQDKVETIGESMIKLKK